MDKSRSAPARHGHVGQWVVVESHGQLLSVGDVLYQAVSPRSVLDITVRQMLLPRIREVLRTGEQRDGPVWHAGQQWATRVFPILGPLSQEPLAVLGCYAAEHERFPSPPMVGAWEWQVTSPGPDQQLRVYWSAELFDVYGLPRPSGVAVPKFEAPQWIDEVVVDADKPDMRQLLDEFLSATTDELTLHTYSVRPLPEGETYRLRFAGRSSQPGPGDMRWLRGVSMRIDGMSAPATGQKPAVVQELLAAAFRVSAEPLCAIDTIYEHIYMSHGLNRLGVKVPGHRYLPHMVHPDDLAALRAFMASVVAATWEQRTEQVQVRFASECDGWVTVDLVGAGVRLSEIDDPHHVLCRITVVS